MREVEKKTIDKKIQPEPLVELKNVSKVFKKKVWAIKNLDLKIYPKECISILGSNGSGKTTLMSLIANDAKPTFGEIVYSLNENDLTKAIGFQKREQEWPNGFIVKDIAKIWINAYDVKDEEWIANIKNVFGVNQIWEKSLSKLSIVKKQLFALFLIFLYKPELVLIDELSSNIDWKYTEQITNFLVEYLKKGNTVILNSPSSSFLEKLSSRVIYIHDGEILDDLQKRKIKRDHKSIANYQKTVFKEESIKERSSNNKRKIFTPIENKLNSYINELTRVIDDIEGSRYDLNQMDAQVRNIVFYTADLKWIIHDFSRADINKHTTKVALKRIKATAAELTSIYKELKKSDEIGAHYATKILSKIINFGRNDLTDAFSNERKLYELDSAEIILSAKEKKELNRLKRKYIAEEIKRLKNESRKQKLKDSIKLKNTKPKDKHNAK
ncbi:ATP-binding cassette domain-containing protein [[Acholeplasma] multilocale]|uniref:ATP-binding cassette domain-containing protein n=1 Tax=[Acholeplasma] multilocale TaxID=264638 RepID=UPI000479B60E|nr:ATP-binding cassette domain-containing protein [[Acholeplasma] multilocale]